MTQHSIWTTHGLAGSILQQVEGITEIVVRDHAIRIFVGYNRDAQTVAKSIGSGYPRREIVGDRRLEMFHVDVDGVDVAVIGGFLVPAEVAS